MALNCRGGERMSRQLLGVKQPPPWLYRAAENDPSRHFAERPLNPLGEVSPPRRPCVSEAREKQRLIGLVSGTARRHISANGQGCLQGKI